MRALRIAGLFAVAVLAGLVNASFSHAAAEDVACRASAVRVTALGADPAVVSEPVRANPIGKPCTTQSSHALQKTTIGPVTAEALTAFTAYSETSAGAMAANAVPEIVLGSLTIRADALVSSAVTECVDGQIVSNSNSRVVGLTINGQAINVPGGPQTIPLGPDAGLSLNETERTDDILAQRALVLRLPGAAEVTLAESIVGGDPCAGDGGGTDPPPTPGVDVCPDGAVYDPETNKCIIPDDNGPAPGGGPVVVGPPFEGPSGGEVVGLPEARNRFKSPCLKGPGAPFVIIGTKRSDRITGTDRRDRLLLFAGNDRAEGGRNHDCLDAGRGKDALSGALGKDRMYGKRGKDLLVGESGNDLLSGGRGNDNPRPGYGRDRVMGGKGVDAINVATNGPAARFIRCGSGKDRVRINRNERTRIRNCERVFVILDRHRG